MMGPQNSSGLGNEVGITVNAIPKGAGGHHMSSSAIFEVSGSVGIGTTSPSAKLHLYDGTNPLTLKIQRTSVPVYFSDVQTGGTIAGAAWSHNVENTSNGSLSWGSFNNAGYAGAAILLNSANSTSSISFYTANNVNTNPSRSMHLNGAGSLQLGTVGSNGVGTSSPITMGFGSTFGTNPVGTNFKLRLYEDTVPNVFGLGVSDSLLEIIAGTSSAIALFTNGFERMRINSTGLVGIGTTSPTSPLTIKAGSRSDTLRLSISGSSSNGDATGITFGSATYDKAQIIAYNENSGNAAGYLTFWTGGSPATTDVTERMRIKSDGSVYVGGTSMANSQKFGIIGSGVWDGATLGLQNTGAGGNTYTIFSTNNQFSQGASNLLFYYNGGPTNNLIIYANGNYDFLGSDVSDRRLKQDIENISFGLNEIMQLSPKSYHLKSSDNLRGEHQTTLRKRHGFIAQEVQSILPDTITGTETETEYLGLDYNGVLAVAVKAIQELKAENDTLKEILQRNNIQ
jgi:hypothetical protein